MIDEKRQAIWHAIGVHTTGNIPDTEEDVLEAATEIATSVSEDSEHAVSQLDVLAVWIART